MNQSNRPLGLNGAGDVYWNLTPAELVERALQQREGVLESGGALVVRTGAHTGRSPKDKFVVKEPSSEAHIWWGNVNQPFDAGTFDRLYRRVLSYLEQKDLYVQDCLVGADPAYQKPIRIITENAWHSLFAAQLFIKRDRNDVAPPAPEYTVIDVPKIEADPNRDGTRSGAFIIINFEKKIVLIGGTAYAGEIKKSMFSVMNYLMPLRGVMSMHAAANVGPNGDIALFFGLSGTGKTSLSTDPQRHLIGDDEIGWSDNGLFNYEGGCYAKCIRLSPKDEPVIYGAIRFGSVLENVVVDENRVLDFNNDAITENTRACYPLTFVAGAVLPSRAGHPKNVIFLTCDAFGVLPPVSKLTGDQAMYHFISGYSAKVAGTEAGIKEPQATFSPCFGAPFMPLHPTVYAKLLKKKMEQTGSDCWLINTGWTGGGYGIGTRIKIAHTRAMVRAILNGTLAKVVTNRHPVFHLDVPVSCPDVPDQLLEARETWKDKQDYDRTAQELQKQFDTNIAQYVSAAP
jgi:phosphoenolpyruvate carboxykinase (ATP)